MERSSKMADNAPPAGWDSAPVVKPEGWDSAPIVKQSGPAVGEYESGPLSQQELARSAALAKDPTAEGDVDMSDPKWQRLTGNTPEDEKSREEKGAAREFLTLAAAPGLGKVAGAVAKPLVRGAAAIAETGKVGNAVQKVADVTAKVRHAASTGGAFAGLSGHSHGAIPIAVDAAVTAAPKITRALERGMVKLGNVVAKSGVPEKTIMDQANLAREMRTAEMHIAERKAVDEARDLAKDAFDGRLSQAERYAATKRAFEKLGNLGNEDYGI